MPKYAVTVKEVKKPVLISAKNNADARRWARKMGLTPKSAVKLHSFTR